MCFPLACCGWMLMTSIFAFGNAMHKAVNTTTTLYYHQGDSANIRCKNPSNDSDIITVKLKKNNNALCEYMMSWRNQSCDDHIRFIWIPETYGFFFELLNLQINDAGTYSCAVTQLAPPPQNILGVIISKVNVFVRPVLFMSCVKRPNRSPTIICTVEGFYPAALEQQWMRDGEIINSSYSHKDENYSTNAVGLFTQKSYLELPPHIFNETIFSCWVNHTSLNEPLMDNLSSTACYDQRDVTLTQIVASVVSAVLFVFVIIVVVCKCQRRAQPQSSVEVSVTPKPVFQSVLQSDVVYSSLGDHHPVPCSRSPSVIWSPLNTD